MLNEIIIYYTFNYITFDSLYNSYIIPVIYKVAGNYVRKKERRFWIKEDLFYDKLNYHILSNPTKRFLIKIFLFNYKNFLKNIYKMVSFIYRKTIVKWNVLLENYNQSNIDLTKELIEVKIDILHKLQNSKKHRTYLKELLKMIELVV